MSQSRLCLRSFDAIGFDMDGVIAKYNFHGFLNHIYKLLIKHLVGQKGYHQQIFPEFDKIKTFCTKGLVLDVSQGNTLKCGALGSVFRASHGTCFLSKARIGQLYPENRFYGYDKLMKNIAIKDHGAFVESLYELPVIPIFASIVDHIDTVNQNEQNREKYDVAMKHIWESLRFIYSPAPKWPTDDPVTFFDHASENVADFVVPCSAAVKKWLRTLRQNKQTVFVLTSSYPKFTKAVLEYVLGPDLEQYFDFYLCRAGKPNFFKASCAFPFHKVDSVTFREDLNEIQSFENGGWYTNGNLLHFNKFLTSFSGKNNPKVVYIGDGLKNDIQPAKQHAKWHSIFILENMIGEGMDNSESDPHYQVLSASDLNYVGSTKDWGSYFSDDTMSANKAESLASAIMLKNADVTAPLLDHLADVPAEHKFVTFDDTPVSGYFPCKPLSAVH